MYFPHVELDYLASDIISEGREHLFHFISKLGVISPWKTACGSIAVSNWDSSHTLEIKCHELKHKINIFYIL